MPPRPWNENHEKGELDEEDAEDEEDEEGAEGELNATRRSFGQRAKMQCRLLVLHCHLPLIKSVVPEVSCKKHLWYKL